MAKLLKIHLENYRNLKSLDLDLEGKDVKIVGANRIGKTNVIEAICYLLTDKLLGGSADIPSIKPHGDTRLTVVVEGVFDIDGDKVTLRKEFAEKWVRPRGSSTEELQGHTTSYFVNGAKQARAQDFCDQLIKKFGMAPDFHKLDAYQLLIDPFYFAEIICGSKDWKLAREAIIEIVGDVTPEEIFSVNPAILVAKADLEAHQYDDGEAKKAIRGEIDGYKKAIITNQGLIDEYSRVEDVTKEEVDAAQAEIDRLSEQIWQLKAGLENPYADEISALQKELFTLQEQYRKTATATVDRTKSEEAKKRVHAIQERLWNIEAQWRVNKNEVATSQADLEAKRRLQETYKRQLEDLRNEMQSIMVDEVCPACGQPIPAEKIQEAINVKKAEISAKAQSIRELAIANKNAIEELESLLGQLSVRSFETEIMTTKVELAGAQADYEKAIKEEDATIQSPDEGLRVRIAQINERLDEIQNILEQGRSEEVAEAERLDARRKELFQVRDRRAAFDRAQRRLAEIKENIQHLGNKQAAAEQRLWAVGEFVKTKLSLLDKHMAERFGEVRFQLIKENIKAGSYDEVCVPYIVSPSTKKGTQTLFPDGSKSEQIFTGIQIIKAIRQAKGWDDLPIVFDQGGELDGATCSEIASNAEAQIIAVKVEGTNTVPTFEPLA